ncbi:tripartite tricarboxylate transporter TctB family protein [Salinicola halophilus]|uniref:tripartite tricarboxylate transporter TctB family protein n=1 Tax=Salinicola halophilus TaxID=184065 RepID=UPI000DA23266|nr:tripartite tricarboxylate transporter TctB family protein [Salinicola halophilus]
MPSRHALRSRLLDGEFVLPAILAVVTLIYLISALELGPPMRGGNMTASFFPIATAIVVLIALVVAMVSALRARPEAPEPAAAASTQAGEEGRDDAPVARRYVGLTPGAIGVIVLTAGYLLAFDLIGYFVATFVYVLLLTGLFSGGLRQQWVSKLVATVAITLAGYLLFEVVFQVRLPTLWSQ